VLGLVGTNGDPCTVSSLRAELDAATESLNACATGLGPTLTMPGWSAGGPDTTKFTSREGLWTVVGGYDRFAGFAPG
jgi:hypothetical protein